MIHKRIFKNYEHALNWYLSMSSVLSLFKASLCIAWNSFAEEKVERVGGSNFPFARFCVQSRRLFAVSQIFVFSKIRLIPLF